MRKISLALAFVASLLALPVQAANFSAKDAAAATIIFTNPGNCTTGCTPIFAWSDSTGANLVAVLTAGADGASNTANGGITYNRNMVFNGTTWDRWQGAVTATLAAETTKVIGTVRIASGGVASGSFASGSIASGAFSSGAIGTGAVASGAVASGAYASGSIASGAMVDLGAQADAACGTDNGTCSAIALIKRGNQNLTSYGSKPLDNSSVAINVSTATTTQLVAISASTVIYVTSFDVIAGGTGNITFVYGTGSSCGTGTTSLTGPYNLTAQAGIAKGSGIGTVLKVPAGNALCVTTSAAVQMSGSVSYQQF
jgi:hypothetical protein